MRNRLLLLGVTSMALASCGPKPLALAADPVERAATCAVVAAADARASAPNHKGDLGFDAQTRILHHAMLAAAEGNRFSASRAAAVVQRMNEIEPRVTDGKWQDLKAPCNEVYPAVARTSGVQLPKSKFDAELGCYALSEFLVRSVSSRDPVVEKEMLGISKVRRDLDGPIAIGLRARGAASFEKGKAMKQAALVEMTNLGAPAEIVRQCKARFT